MPRGSYTFYIKSFLRDAFPQQIFTKEERG